MLGKSPPAPAATPPAATQRRPQPALVRAFGWLGILGIGAALGAILGALDVAGWIVGLAASAATVALGFLLRRALAA